MSARAVNGLALLCACAALVGCGGSGDSQSGYYNMRTLAQVLEERAHQAGAFGITATCARTGKQTAECHVSREHKTAASVEVSISADGKTFITH
jgi:hypothetical protein